MANKQFKVFCKDLDEIISIRSFDHANESKLYDHFKTYISKTPTSYSVKKYKKKLVDTLLLDASSYYVCDDLEDVDLDNSLQDEIIEALYGTVLEAYPHFQFEFICNDINNSIAFEHMRSLLKEEFSSKELGLPQTLKQTNQNLIKNLAETYHSGSRSIQFFFLHRTHGGR